MAGCRDYCLKIKVPIYHGDGSMYDKGFLRCNFCSIFLNPIDARLSTGKVEKWLCPCCGHQLRWKARSRTRINKLLKQGKSIPLVMVTAKNRGS